VTPAVVCPECGCEISEVAEVEAHEHLREFSTAA
jgi:hypothetical protein